MNVYYSKLLTVGKQYLFLLMSRNFLYWRHVQRCSGHRPLRRPSSPLSIVIRTSFLGIKRSWNRNKLKIIPTLECVELFLHSTLLYGVKILLKSVLWIIPCIQYYRFLYNNNNYYNYIFLCVFFGETIQLIQTAWISECGFGIILSLSLVVASWFHRSPWSPKSAVGNGSRLRTARRDIVSFYCTY
jgi:hypothetical protein